MPIPSPSTDESRQTFVSRCMRSLTEENKNRKEKWSNDQMAAICFEKWKSKSSKSEMMEDEEMKNKFMKKCMEDKDHTEEDCMREWEKQKKNKKE